MQNYPILLLPWILRSRALPGVRSRLAVASENRQDGCYFLQLAPSKLALPRLGQPGVVLLQSFQSFMQRQKLQPICAVANLHLPSQPHFVSLHSAWLTYAPRRSRIGTASAPVWARYRAKALLASATLDPLSSTMNLGTHITQNSRKLLKILVVNVYL